MKPLVVTDPTARSARKRLPGTVSRPIRVTATAPRGVTSGRERLS